VGKGLDKAFLERCLADGMSLPQIGRMVGRDPSTVGYWVTRHGLVANGRDRYSGKGPLDRHALKQLLSERYSVSAIARVLGTSPGRVRYWINKHGLEIDGGRRRLISEARAAGAKSIELTCPRHGVTDFWLSSTRARCKRCNNEAVAERRRTVKQILVDEAGGRCSECGYSRCSAALEFHHLDPSTKRFGIAGAGCTRSIDSSRREAAKCVLLCANCHAEVEVGMRKLPVK
jgi:transposase-like protein